jgi:hypothetical protein
MFDDLIRRMLMAGGNRKAACFAYGVVKGLDYSPSVIKMGKISQEHYDGLSTRSDYVNWMRYFQSKTSLDKKRENAELMAAVVVNLIFDHTVVDTAVALATRAYVAGSYDGVVISREDEIIRQLLILMDLFDPQLTVDPDPGRLSYMRTDFKFPSRKPLDRKLLLANDMAACRLAVKAYGKEDWQTLPVLADALEEAACPDQYLLDHLRNGKEHYRGCWALDHILAR